MIGVVHHTADWRHPITESRRRRLRLWFWSIAAATLVMVALGGITRLTQSGLSIVDWHPLMGVVPPLNEAQWTVTFERYRQYPEYQQLRRGMTLGEFKTIFFWEYLHRLVARSLGVLFLVPFVFFWRAGDLPRPLLWRALGLFALGALQGIMGWLMVKSGLVDRPAVSHYRLAAHLSLALVILGWAVWLACSLAGRARPLTAAARRTIGRGLRIVGLLVALQIIWGAFVAGMKAGLIFNTFPLMGGQILPPSGLALEPAALNLVQNMPTVQWMHRLLGTIVLISAVVFFIRVRRVTPEPWVRHFNATLVLLIGIQYLLGVTTLIYGVPTSIAVLHQVTAGLIVVVWVAWLQSVSTQG